MCLTVEQFWAWLDEVPGDARYELVKGQIVPHPDYFSFGGNGLAAADNEHALIVMRIGGLLGAQIAPPCYVYGGAGTKVADKDARIPDLAVSCADDPKGKALIAPRLLVEVSSPSTAKVDTGLKVEEYGGIASLEAYLFVDRKNRALVLYRPSLPPETYTEGRVPLFGDVALTVADVFA